MLDKVVHYSLIIVPFLHVDDDGMAMNVHSEKGLTVSWYKSNACQYSVEQWQINVVTILFNWTIVERFMP